MSITFDGPNRLMIADPGTTLIDVGADLWSRWIDWMRIGDNAKYELAMRVVGGDPTVGGNTIAGYFFLTNGWKLRPQEANHTLTIDGILLDDSGGDPYVSTLGTFNVRINATIPLQAEAIIVETGVSGLTQSESNQLSLIDQIQTLVDELHKLQGLDASNPMTVTTSSRTAGTISQTITGDGENTSTVTRNP